MLTPKQTTIFEKVKSLPQLQSIPRSLHNVGDDGIKNDIDDTLKELLQPDAYLTVKAIFAVYTDDDLFNILDKHGFFESGENT